MDRFLALPARDRQVAFEQTGLARGLTAASIEKDFWVTLTLRELFAIEDLQDHLTFKGGTSISKAWHLIDRFSEDVDLTLGRELLGLGEAQDPERANSNKQRQKRLENLVALSEKYIHETLMPSLQERFEAILSATETWTLAPDPDESQTLLFHYPRASAGTAPAYLTPAVKLEFGARSDPWPVADRTITALVAEEFPNSFDDPEVHVRALLPERTFWEKVMLVHEETFRPADRPQRRRLSRHYYDLSRLIAAGIGAKAAKDVDLFERVAAHRSLYFRQTWVDYETLKRGSLRLAPSPARLPEWRRDYDQMRGEMLAGDAPTFDDIISTVREFEQEFNLGGDEP